MHLVNISTRIIDIDDIILNATSILIGYYLIFLFSKVLNYKST
ncbi:MAG: hypothetical protein ACI4XL_07155 [Bacillus sp. (in: firmicutes)]